MYYPPPYTIFPLGDTALTLDFGNIIAIELNRYVLSLYHHFKRKNYPGILDIVPAYSSLSFHYDILEVRQSADVGSAFNTVKGIIERELTEFLTPETSKQRTIRIPVCYSSIFALDIEYIAYEKGLSTEEIIRLHTDRLYTVYMIGFLPGFPYLGDVHDALAAPRKQQLRAIVPAGSVGIAGKQTGIYPLESPGGWQIIGRTPLKMFDKEKREPVLLQPGDSVQFYAITEDEFENY